MSFSCGFLHRTYFLNTGELLLFLALITEYRTGVQNSKAVNMRTEFVE